MALGLHRDCLARMEAGTLEALKATVVSHGQYANLQKGLAGVIAADQALPQSGKAAKSLRETLGELPYAVFLREEVSRRVFESREFQVDGGEESLGSLPEFSDLDVLAHELVLEFETLPWEYKLTLELVGPFPTRLTELELPADTISFGSEVLLLPPGAEDLQALPTNSSNEQRERRLNPKGLLGLAALQPKPLTWGEIAHHLTICTRGHIGHFVEGETVERSWDMLKSFLGLCVAEQVVSVEPKQAPTSEVPVLFAHVHRRIGDDWILENAFEVPADLKKVLASLQFVEGPSEVDPAAWFRRCIDDVKAIYDAGSAADRCKLAGVWLMDSYSGTGDLLSFVQATVAAEILLGAGGEFENLVGLTELMSNRCAYLISNSHEERDQIRREFRDIYRVRSKIVHAGKNRLTIEDRAKLDRLRRLCARIIQRERKLLAQNK